MVLWSDFCKYMNANRSAMPARDYATIRRLGCERIQERWSAGRADSPLDFSDLASRAEKLIAPK